MNVETIIKQKLEELGADGLVDMDKDCACYGKQLMQCHEYYGECKPAKFGEFKRLYPIETKDSKCQP